jgi:hypothetical protein
VVNHSGLLREQGGQVLWATAGQFGGADEDVAAGFGATSGAAGGALAGAAGPAAAALTAIPAPLLPPIPAIPPPPTVPGDVFSQLVHSKPGGGAGLREAASQWRSNAATLRDLGEQLNAHGHNIGQQWQDDGPNYAAIRVIRHGHWLSDRGGDAEDFARTIERCADHYDRTVAGTPRPEQFEQIRHEADQLARMNGNGRYTGDIMALRGRYAQLAGQATEKMVTYHGSLTETLAGVNRPIEQAPPLVGGHGGIWSRVSAHRIRTPSTSRHRR